MVVLPRHRRRNPYGNNSPYAPSNSNVSDDDRRRHSHSQSSRLFSHQTLLLLMVGMGLGYVVTVNMGGKSSESDIGLDAIVKNLELQRASAASRDAGADHAGPMNMMHNSHREAAALLRGDAMYHRSLSSSDHAEEPEEASAEEAASAAGSAEEEAASAEAAPAPEEAAPAAVAPAVDQEVTEEALSAAQQRFIETQKLIASQSIPTSTNPHVMKTPEVPDSRRKKIIVTGGAGFVGSHLVDKLMMEGHEVIVVDNFFTGQRKNIAHWMHHPRFTLVVHDVTEPIMLEVDEIYHLACPASPPHYQYNPVKTIKTSTMGTINMLGLAKRVKAKILLTSTSEIYGDPKVHPQPESYWGNVNTIGPRACYDEGKRVAETMMYSYKNQNDVDVRVARIFNTFGPRMHPNDGRVVSNFIIQSLQDKPMTIYGDGSQTRSFQFVSDLVDGLHALMNGGYDMPVNLGNPDEYTVKHFAEYIKEITGSGSDITFLPATKDDPTQRKPDIATAKRELEWEPKVSVKEGLQQTISYFSRVLEESGEIIPTGQEASKPKPKVADEA
mmetsp:Transcript_35660/g.60702  ORF Transcript_35660/g.60702 Transcript_35660/m.60702 type:complete len:555 (+) Transcript_35660:118-1782(+)|eukprot:CAMPEP_0183710062 /NCGR_PEP_ID=MMETSP0737-20130205/5931_1 /TAXON_ID=385413 /ORGANISM="Thalassiosira miniscula, Strain CCMP1093" /LENGTH=554 /DNA_ID=CAMNT_0025938285 /DNA_START=93 /DNA_END=1757 /DNA_ORIENTATION=-